MRRVSLLALLMWSGAALADVAVPSPRDDATDVEVNTLPTVGLLKLHLDENNQQGCSRAFHATHGKREIALELLPDGQFTLRATGTVREVSGGMSPGAARPRTTHETQNAVGWSATGRAQRREKSLELVGSTSSGAAVAIRCEVRAVKSANHRDTVGALVCALPRDRAFINHPDWTAVAPEGPLLALPFGRVTGHADGWHAETTSRYTMPDELEVEPAAL